MQAVSRTCWIWVRLILGIPGMHTITVHTITVHTMTVHISVSCVCLGVTGTCMKSFSVGQNVGSLNT